MYPTILNFGTFEIFGRTIPLAIHSYGLMLALGFLAANFLLYREYRRREFDTELVNRIILAAILGGIFGAKGYSAIENWRGFLQDPFGSFFSGSGLVWYGGLAVGSLAVWFVIWRSDVPTLAGIDSLGPVLALGYAFGRFG